MDSKYWDGVREVESAATPADAGAAQSDSHRAVEDVIAGGDGTGADADADSLCAPACPDFEDAEGWMRERPSYWADMAAASVAPSRAAWLRNRLVSAWEALRSLGRRPDHIGEARISRAEWSALFEAEVGPVSADDAGDADDADDVDGADGADGADSVTTRIESSRHSMPTRHHRCALDTARPSEGSQPHGGPSDAE
jgi:hypothetical protein